MNIKDDGKRGILNGDTGNLPAYKAWHQKGSQFAIGGTPPLAQHGVFWLNCFERPAKRDVT